MFGIGVLMGSVVLLGFPVCYIQQNLFRLPELLLGRLMPFGVSDSAVLSQAKESWPRSEHYVFYRFLQSWRPKWMYYCIV